MKIAVTRTNYHSHEEALLDDFKIWQGEINQKLDDISDYFECTEKDTEAVALLERKLNETIVTLPLYLTGISIRIYYISNGRCYHWAVRAEIDTGVVLSSGERTKDDLVSISFTSMPNNDTGIGLIKSRVGRDYNPTNTVLVNDPSLPGQHFNRNLMLVEFDEYRMSTMEDIMQSSLYSNISIIREDVI